MVPGRYVGMGAEVVGVTIGLVVYVQLASCETFSEFIQRRGP